MAHSPGPFRQYGNRYGSKGHNGEGRGFRPRARILLLCVLAVLSFTLILRRQYNSFQNASSSQQSTSYNTTAVWISVPPPKEEEDESNRVSLASPAVADLWTDTKKKSTIPLNIWFTYEHDIFEAKEPAHFYNNVQKTSHIYTRAFTNGNDPSSSSPDNIRVTCMDNDYCRRLIDSVYPDLVQYFDTEPEGCYKGDICRLAALYLHGGYYFDVDIEVIKPFVISPSNSDAASDKTSFATCIELTQWGMFQAFIAAPPRHPLIKANLDTIYLYYKNNGVEGYLMGPMTMVDAYRSLVGSTRVSARNMTSGIWERQRPAHMQIVQPRFDTYQRDVANNVPLLSESDREALDQSIELLQENHLDAKKYPKLVPRKRPKGDIYTATCNVVVDHPKTQIAYFWARIVGSSNCPFTEKDNEIGFFSRFLWWG